jgi:dTDP-4-amino-4,6-dideoxygalactose transaminase
VQTPGRRDELMAALKQVGIASYIHYPLPVHRQEAYAFLGHAPGDFPVAEALAARIVSLPLYPELPFADIERVVDAIVAFYS